MKHARLERIYIITLLVILIGVVIHAPLSVWLGTLFPDYSLVIKSWKEILMLLLIPLACVIVSHHALWPRLAKDWIFRIIVLYALLHILLSVLMWQGILPAIAGLAIDLRYVLFFALTCVAVLIWPGFRRPALIVVGVGACIVVVFATLQLFLPPDILSHIGYGQATIEPYLTVDKNPDYIRVNSTLRGPNPLGAYAGMVLALLAAAIVMGKIKLKDRRVRIAIAILAVCSSVALWISYSRSALVAGIVAVLIVVLLAHYHKVSRKVWIISCAIIFALVGGILAAREVPVVSNVIFHENPNGGSSVSSNDDHVSSLQYGIAQLVREPLGSGVGSTGSASLFGDSPALVENQFLFIAHETGWFGFVLFVTLFVFIMKRLWQNRNDWLSLGVFASGIGLSMIGLLLPVWTDDTVSIVWWGLAGIAIIGGKYVRRTTKQKTA